MEKRFKMSLFMPPISPIKDKATGRTMKYATLEPLRTVDLKEVCELITNNPRLAALTLEIRNAAARGDLEACRMLKQQTLPYVTPCGVFTRRKSDCISQLSGLGVVDIDHLSSTQEAEELKQLLFDDPYLKPELVFVSPTGRGVKAFVPYPQGVDATEGIRWAMHYVHCMYDTEEGTKNGTGVDTSGKDLVRSCFLCHDPKARIRMENEKGKMREMENGKGKMER